MKQIYIDLDGVLFDFDSYAEQQFGKYIDDATLWKNINNHGKFFESLPPFENAIELWKSAKALDPDAKILTATGWRYEDVTKQKVAACLAHFGIKSSDIITVKSGKDKAAHAKPNAILVDDMMKNIEAWEDAGGIGIWHCDIVDSILELEMMFRN